MVEEIEALDENEGWDFVELPDRRKPIGSKWVFKKKLNVDGKIQEVQSSIGSKRVFLGRGN